MDGHATSVGGALVDSGNFDWDAHADTGGMSVHVFGSRVAVYKRQVWMGSPKCQELMKEKGMTKAHDLSEYFICLLYTSRCV